MTATWTGPSDRTNKQGLQWKQNPGGTYVSSDESAMMHSMQTSLRKRMTNRLSFDFHYTYGQTMAFAGGDVGLYYATDSQDDNQTFDDLALERSETRFSTGWLARADHISPWALT